MPKISKHHYHLRLEGTFKSYEVDIMYSTSDGFYAKLPLEFSEIIAGLTTEEKNKHSITVIYKGSAMNRTTIVVVDGSTESQCKDNFNTAVRFLSTRVLVERPVILLYFADDASTSYGTEHYNKEHGNIGMRLALGYGKETIVGEGTPSYQVRKTSKGNPDWVGWGKVNEYRNNFKVLDDTPENREFVEDLYERFKDLRERLTKLTATPESIIKFIESKQKLLT